MREVQGNLWSQEADVIVVIPTNGEVKTSGQAVMGKGCAKDAVSKFPGLDFLLGAYIRRFGNRVFYLGIWGPDATPIVSMPTKRYWRESSNIQLIATSARQLVELADKFGFQKIALPRAGCGAGSLSWSEVGPILTEILDDRFTVVSF